MLRARRLALLAVLAVVGTLALTGCRAQPDTAIYIGSTSYSQQYVDDLAGQLAKMPNISRPDSRQTIVQWIIERDLGQRLVADKHWDKPKIDEQAATSVIQNGLRQSGSHESIESLRPFIRLYAQRAAYQSAVQQHITPVQVTDADYADLYRRAKAAGQVPANMDEAAYTRGVRQNQDNEQMLQAVLGVRKLYADAAKTLNVSLNPKYGPAELVLLSDQQNNAMVVLPLGNHAGQPAVVPAPVNPQPQGPVNG